MRCPKCGYASFDNLERCKKCKKNIAAAATALMGTVVNAVAPSFLTVAPPTQSQDAASDANGADLELNFNDDSSLDFKNEEDELFSLDADESETNFQETAAESPDEDSDLDLRLSDNFGETQDPHEPALDMELDLALDEVDEAPLNLAKDEASEIASPPSLDLEGLDISDLQAPEIPSSQGPGLDSTLSLEDDPVPVQTAAQEGVQIGADEFSLEDLQVEDFTEAKPGVQVADDQYQPGMKTGTALDNFNFELDELLDLSENEKA